MINKKKRMNSKLMAAMFAIVAVGSLGVVGIVNNIPSADAKVLCNPSDDVCSDPAGVGQNKPPGKTPYNNVGQCKHTLEDEGVESGDSREICKDYIKNN
jgi:hypothetical protein